MKTRHDHKLGARLFLTVPNYSLDSGKWAFLFLSIYDPFTIIVEKKQKTPQTWQDKCSRKKKLGVQIQKYHYRDWQTCMFRMVCRCIRVEGLWNECGRLSRGALSLEVLLHVVLRTEFSLQNCKELKAPGPRVVQIHSLQGTSPVRFLNIILEPRKHASFPQLGFFTSYKKINK